MAFEPIRAFCLSKGREARIRSDEAAIGSTCHLLTMTAPFQSKLIPHEDFIREGRVKRWSYPRIAASLLDQYELKVAASTIHHFVKVRARKRRPVELPSKPSSQPLNAISNPTDGFFEPAPVTSHEIRKPKYNITL
jgi:hypothetical protein